MCRSVRMDIMKLLLALTLSLVALSMASSHSLRRNDKTGTTLQAPSSLGMKEYYFDHQVVDHFNPLSNDTYAQRYFVNDTFWDSKSGPVFIFLAGEAPAEFFEFQEVSALAWAKDFNALYVSLEHRYYGKSFPVNNMETANMQFLSSQQALADAANFIEWFIDYNKLTSDNKWVVFGCSYSGALSAWFRTKYPNLVVASIAPSGPVEAQTDYPQYLEVFSTAASPECITATKDAVAKITAMSQTKLGLSQLSRTFQVCEPLTKDNLDYFLWTITMDLGSADQFQNPPDWPLNATCDIMLNTTGSDVVSNWAKVVLAPQDEGGPGVQFRSGERSSKSFVLREDGTTCFDNSLKSFIKSYSDTSITSSNAEMRSWMWQKCTEFGFFKTSYGGSSIFFDNLTVGPLVDFCSEIFGIDNMAPDTTWTNTYYGGQKNLSGTNIMFTNGMADPWHTLSVIEDLHDGQVKAVTYAAGHCAPMTAPTAEDPPSLTAARTAVRNFLGDVLDQ